MNGSPAIRSGNAPTADGRRLAYRDTGDPDGTAVVSHHGTPGSRLDRHPDDDRVMAELGLRIITYDRPGYGGSDPHPGRRVADAAADVSALGRASSTCSSPGPTAGTWPSACPNARFELIPGAGHALDDHWPAILAWVAGADAA